MNARTLGNRIRPPAPLTSPADEQEALISGTARFAEGRLS